MLNRTLIAMVLSCLAFAAFADREHRYPNRWQKDSLEGLEIDHKTDDVWLQIKVGNDSEGDSKVEVVDILSYAEGVNIHCLNNSVDYRVAFLNRKADYARADFNTADLQDCDNVYPIASDIHVECGFDGERKLDITTGFRERTPDGVAAGHSRIKQASATCTVTVTGGGNTYAFRRLAGELTNIRQYSK